MLEQIKEKRIKTKIENGKLKFINNNPVASSRHYMNMSFKLGKEIRQIYTIWRQLYINE